MKFNKLTFFALILGVVFVSSCSDDDHDHDHDHDGEELINRVTLTFTPSGGGTDVTAVWFDADGEGSQNPTIGDINLAANTMYQMSVMLENTLEEEIEDVTLEIAQEDDEHQFFFQFTTGIFSSPAGSGNVVDNSGAINYGDVDGNGNPVGLTTNWTTGDAIANAGTFRIALKHQPDIKTSTTTFMDGGTDIDISFPININ